jgi:hypothetical protein
MKSFAATALRAFAYLWFAIALALITASVGFEFYRGDFGTGMKK